MEVIRGFIEDLLEAELDAALSGGSLLRVVRSPLPPRQNAPEVNQACLSGHRIRPVWTALFSGRNREAWYPYGLTIESIRETYSRDASGQRLSHRGGGGALPEFLPEIDLTN
jgi:hypothetical protein